VSRLALPLVAVVVLNASSEQMGVIAAAGYVPFVLVGLQAGVWVDRTRRRRLLLVTDVGLAILLLSVPAAAMLGILSVAQLIGLAFIVGCVEVVSAVAYQAFIPSLVPREGIAGANSRLEASASVARIFGPSAGGILVQLFTAPLAIVIDAATFLASAAFLGAIRAPEPPPLPDDSADMRGLAREGLRHVVLHPILRPIMVTGATHNFFRRMIEALFVLYVVREVGLDPVLLGAILAVGGPAALLGSIVAVPVTQRIGVGSTIVWGQVLTGVACFAAPLAGGPPWASVVILGIGEFLLGLARPVFNITQLSLRQSITPERLQGRVNATMRFLMWGVTPIGALTGGVLGGVIGVRSTLFVAACGVLVAAVWVATSPVRELLVVPAHGGD
jgi:MFS family permease